MPDPQHAAWLHRKTPAILHKQVFYNKGEYISTASGNKVSRKSVLCGSQSIHITGKSIIKPGVMLRGDLAILRLGKYVIVGENSVIRPSLKRFKGQLSYFPVTIGDYVTIGESCVISAAQIGSNVVIGDGCVVGRRCILKDNCTLLPGTVLAADTTVPSFTIVSGCPGRIVGELPESGQSINKEIASSIYKQFVPKAGATTPETTSPVSPSR